MMRNVVNQHVEGQEGIVWHRDGCFLWGSSTQRRGVVGLDQVHGNLMRRLLVLRSSRGLWMLLVYEG